MDFLKQRTNSAIKRELRSIQDSYHHYWDPIAELLQNARDAIERAKQEGHEGPHFIKLEIDSGARSIQIRDNGIGISKDRIIEVLAPGGGDKTDREGEVGEKGVGLTYTIFCGGKFQIESRTADGGHYCGHVEGGVCQLNCVNSLS